MSNQIVTSDLDVALVQSSLFWEDPESNLRHFAQTLEGIKDADLIVLPEMFSTGFTMNAAANAERKDGKAVSWMRETAKQKGCTLTGSLVFEEDQHYYNRLFWVRNDGNVQTYDKRHLFRMAEEEKTYTAGKTKLITDLKDWKICPLICYDLRFPVWIRKQEHYDVLIFVANWPEKRNYAWKQLLIARAIENQCYVIGVNRVGTDGKGHSYSGDSMVIGPWGNVLLQCEPNAECVQKISLSYKELEDFRSQFPAWRDADQFQIL